MVMFFKNCDPSFDRSLFWRSRSRKEHAKECCRDETIWDTGIKTKNEEITRVG